MGTNYGRGIIKQVEELTLENERLICENKQLRVENKELCAQLKEMETTTAAAIGKLVTEIERLKAQINKNSGNSSKPPSQDGFKNVPNSREASGRKSGGQLGHPGKRLEIPKNLDELVDKGLARREVHDHKCFLISLETVVGAFPIFRAMVLNGMFLSRHSCISSRSSWVMCLLFVHL